MAVNPSIITRDLDKVSEETGNIYESIHLVGQRAKQISNNLKEELNGKLSEFASTVDNLEEVFENKEQIEISKFYERMPKPSTLAMEEYLDGKLYHRYPEEETE
ncbi:DNA-directed RNA polymerase subunit omega [Algoriphagus sp. NF]|jgi:DNA-directed RNA polymerase subunit K/omega|uniref:DNA-directed RNA polymerase subunit omega n=3 Tax=Algoriphagus TaxID=246875 RepID=A0ABS7N7K6_9BACT|nr:MULTISPECIES: DNA-directed RNA polymerase subunit omega [Algoriphagus]KPQ16617.1 MAG: RNA polymerase Rpb6 [Algoriphagus marincola HL-49]MCR9080929.1 DNA-directed RNA polymerase subunit omega [Cyclobacteriaceae bacterium]MBY5952320.1 DNA-directed RNA polymerase subunit omega [Algoriphagus marincola]MDE0559837.1 DNA-directed RNA polymerase subunit omega [Algoriphagus sp. NF]TDK44765.1 DNA-directed RNA polymerase subunit omega [Algoriphagus aquimaris]